MNEFRDEYEDQYETECSECNKADNNVFQEIGELAMEPVNSAWAIGVALISGETPRKKDILTVVGGIASLALIAKIF